MWLTIGLLIAIVVLLAIGVSKAADWITVAFATRASTSRAEPHHAIDQHCERLFLEEYGETIPDDLRALYSNVDTLSFPCKLMVGPDKELFWISELCPLSKESIAVSKLHVGDSSFGFARDDFDNLFFIALEPGPRGVYYWDHDSGSKSLLCENIAALFTALG